MADNDDVWRERPDDDELMECAREAVRETKEKGGGKKEVLEAFKEKMKAKDKMRVDKEEVEAALETASKELDWDEGFVEERNYDTEDIEE